MSKQTVYCVLREGGLSRAAVIGFMANIESESKFRANNVEDEKGWSDEEYVHALNTCKISKARFAEDGIGFGLCQWTHRYRKQRLYDFAYMSNESFDDDYMQCKFILFELENDYPILFSFLRTTDNICEATKRIMDEYENPDMKNFEDRYKLALQLEEEIAETGGGERMKKEEAVHKLCKLAYEQVGYYEGANNWNKYADNALVTQALGWNAQNQPWCAIFVVDMMIESFGYYAGMNMMYGCSAGCAVQADYYRRNAAFYDKPQKGDQIFFYSGGGINHTGIVTDIAGSTITTIEGNSSDGVNLRTYFIGDGNIAGYGRPNWDIVADSGEEEKPEIDDEDRTYRTLQFGDGINHPLDIVRIWQMILLQWGYMLQAHGGVDGEFGKKTEEYTKDLQKRCGIVTDGIVGEETWKQAIKMPKGV